MFVVQAPHSFAEENQLSLNIAANFDLSESSDSKNSGEESTDLTQNKLYTTFGLGLIRPSGLYMGAKGYYFMATEHQAKNTESREDTQSEVFWRAFGPSIGYHSKNGLVADLTLFPFNEVNCWPCRCELRRRDYYRFFVNESGSRDRIAD